MNLLVSFRGVSAVQLLLTNMGYVGGFPFSKILETFSLAERLKATVNLNFTHKEELKYEC